VLYYDLLGGLMDRERTLVLIKPDAVERNLVGPIIKHFEKNGIFVRAIKMTKLSIDKAKSLYAEHEGKPFYSDLLKYITSGPIVAVIIEGSDSVKRVRSLIGNTNPEEAEDGTIRRLYAISKQKNSVHASDSPNSAAKELDCIFNTRLAV